MANNIVTYLNRAKLCQVKNDERMTVILINCVDAQIMFLLAKQIYI